MATEVGAAYVRLLPTMRGFTAEAQKQLSKSLNEAGKSAGEEAGEESSKGFMGKFKDRIGNLKGPIGKAVGFVAKSVAGIGAVVGGLAIHGGITRLMGLEKANQQMRSMGLKVKQVQGLTIGLLKVLKGTPYALNEGATAMAGLVSAGVPIKKVTKYMSLITDAAAFAQQPLGEISLLFQKIQNQGRVQGDEIMQMAERGLPAIQVLSKGLGKTVQETQKAMRKGEISADDFFAAWEKGAQGFGKTNVKIAGAAKGAGDTTAGAFANMKAALSRLGESLLGAVFPDVKTFFNGVSNLADETAARVKPFADLFWRKLADGVEAGKARLKPLAADAGEMVRAVDWAGITSGFVDAAKEWGGGIFDGFLRAVQDNDWKGFGKAIGEAASSALEGAGQLSVGFVKWVGEQANQVNWYSLGIEIGKQAIGFVAGLIIGIANFNPTKLFQNMAGHWGETFLGLLFIALLPAKVVGMFAKALAKIPLAGPLLAWGFRAIDKFAKGMFKIIARGIGFIGKQFFAGFARVFPQIGARLSGWLVSLFWRLDSFFRSIPGMLRGFVSGLAGWMRTTVGTLANWAGELFARAIAAGGRGLLRFGSWLKGIPGVIGGTITALIGAMYTWGVDLIQGFINGIIDKAKELPGVLKNKVVNVVNKFLPSALEIGSPSKLTEQYGRWVTQGFINGLKADSSEVKSTMDDIIQSLIQDSKQGVAKLVGIFSKKILKQTKKRDSILAALGEQPDNRETAWDKFSRLQDQALGFRNSIRDTFKSTSDVTQMTANNFAELVGFMGLAKKNATDFSSTIAKLQKLGLNKTTLQQLLDQGPESLNTAQLILSGGKAGVKELNSLVSGIKKAGDTTAKATSKYFYDAGIQAARGLIAGLQAKQNAVESTITALGKQLVAVLKRELGIHSPSRVFELLGNAIPEGFAKGIAGGNAQVLNELATMTTVPGFMKGSTLTTELLGHVPAQLTMPGVGGTRAAASEQAAFYLNAGGLNRALLEWLRGAIKAEGGDVQEVLGSGKRKNR